MSLALDNGGVIWDCIQIRKDVLLFYRVYEGNRKPKPIQRTGKVNEQNIRRFKKYFNILLQFSNVKTNRTKEGLRFTWRLNFLTLTMPAKPRGDDDVAKAFYLLRKKIVYHGLRYYLWRKEIQPGTDNVHYHIVSNHFLHYSKLQSLWNDALKKHCPNAMQAFFEKHGHKNPPSTEVRAIRSVHKCIAYAAKYLSKDGKDDEKEEEKQDGKDDGKVEGNTFGISRALLSIRYPVVIAEDITERMNFHTDEINDFLRIARAEYIELPEILKKEWSAFVDNARKVLN